MMRLTEEDYDSLKKAVIDSATGSNGLVPKSATRHSYGVDSNGDKVVMLQTQEASAPNVKLALMLLDERIGGPQDYC